MRRTAALFAFAIMLTAGHAFAGAEGRIVGKIVDAATKAPIPNANIHVSAVESKKFEQDYKGEQDGTYKIFLVDATIRYKFTVTAPDHAPYEEVVKMPIGQTTTKDFWLGTGAVAAAAAAPKPVDTGVTAYNDGAKLYNEGKVAEAAAKFEEAVKVKPELIAGWEALARSQFRLKAYPKAIEAALKALELAPDETDMFAVLADSYQASGDKAKAAEWKKKMPLDAAGAFNQAVALLNKNDDAGAEPFLKQAIAADEKFANAYFELGMVYVRSGKLAEAKANITKYLELDPKGPNAATAKETLNYLK
jgi:tetratricopeptide (TPR) repeat protein